PLFTEANKMHGFLKPKRNIIRRRRRRNRGGEQVAVVRALTGAMLHLGMPIPPQTLAQAAKMTGSSVAYIQAMLIILKAEDKDLIEHVSRGLLPLVSTAAQVKRRAELIAALRQANAEERVAALKHVVTSEGILNIAVAAEAAE